MKSSKLFLVGVIVLALISLSAVSASDNITDDALSLDDTIAEPLGEEIDETLQADSGDEVLSANESGMKITIVKQEQSGKVHVIDENKDIYVNDHDSDYFRIYFPQEVTGTLSLFIDGNHLQDKEIFSKKHFMFVNTRSYNLGEGNHTWKIDYSGDDDFNPASLNGTFYLNPASPDFVKKNSKMEVYTVTKGSDDIIYAIDENKDLSIKNTKTDYFKVKFPKEVSGTLYLYIDGKLKATKKIKNKNHYFFANAESYNLKAGKHTWKIVYSGDDEYNSTSVNGTYTLNINVVNVPVKKIAPSMSLAKTKNYKTSVKTKKYTVTMKVNKKAFKKVKVYMTIKGKNYKKTFSATTNNKGQATFKITKLTKKGTYTATVNYKGNRNYKWVKTEVSIKITKKNCKFTRGKTTVAKDEVRKEEEITSHIDGPVDTSEAYASLAQFRAEKGVWQWDENGKTKTVFNTNSSNTLKALEIDEDLEKVAKQRAEEVAYLVTYNKTLTHTRPDGTEWYTIYPTTEDGFYGWGENIAPDRENGKDATEAWKETNNPYAQQGHRRNMLSPDFNCVGIGAYQLDGKTYWVQAFGYKKTA